MEPERLMEKIAERQIDALKALYEQYRYLVYAIAQTIVHDKSAAEDIVQETFVRIYEKAATYRPGTNLKAWIAAMARNLSYDVLRRQSKMTLMLPEGIADAAPSSETALVQKMELEEALRQLGEQERQIVILYVIGGLKHAEISQVLGMPPGTVRWKYRQSLRRLAQILGGEDVAERNIAGRTAHFQAEK